MKTANEKGGALVGGAESGREPDTPIFFLNELQLQTKHYQAEFRALL